MTQIILILAGITAALMAGLFYAYSCSVIPGLGRLGDSEYLAAMQSINRSILNPVFFLAFMGTLVLLPLSAFLHYSTGRFALLLAAALVYIIGVFGVTMAGNVPLNNGLEAIDLSAGADVLATQRKLFENRWNMLNHVRSIAAVLTIALLLVACLKPAIKA